MRILIAGGTGLIGKKLSDILSVKGDEVIVLTRSDEVQHGSAKEYIKWTGNSSDMEWVEKAGKVDAVFNLSGRSISDKWDEAVKRSLETSRIDSTRAIVEGMGKMEAIPKTLINASAIGYYGSRGNEVLTEESPPGDDFFAKLCINWENEAMKAEDFGTRVITTRTSIVLDPNQGALPQLVAPLRKGLGSRLGNGNQWVSWIHVDDVSNAMAFLLESSMKGPVNLASPNPMINKDFMKTVAKAMGKKAWIPAPAAVLRGMLGEMADYLLLASQRVSGGKLIKGGYNFRYTELDSALKTLL